MMSVDPKKVVVPKIADLFNRDGYLKPFEKEIKRRYGCFQKLLQQIETGEGGIEKFSRGYEKYGIHVNPDNSITCLEWAPLAQGLFLKGDFSMLALCPRSETFLQRNNLQQLASAYSINGALLDQKHELPLVKKLLTIDEEQPPSITQLLSFLQPYKAAFKCMYKLWPVPHVSGVFQT